MTNPKVSVAIITYNHEAFIEQAVDSVLMQETDFEFEILISEDCSADGTRGILMAVRDRWPDRIRLLLSERNQFDNEVLTRCFAAARGEYIALLEGDDYWTSFQKLQKQVDFLDGHPECVSCFHPAELVYEKDVKEELPNTFQPKLRFRLEDLLVSGCFIETATVMFRRQAAGDLPDWYRDTFCGDWALHVLLAQRGEIGYIDEPMAAHRYHQQGVWTRLDVVERLQKIIQAYSQVQMYLGPRGKCLKKALAAHWYGLAVQQFLRGNGPQAMECASKGLAQSRFHPKLILLRYAPWAWKLGKSITSWIR